jgi:hypothetical protein
VRIVVGVAQTGDVCVLAGDAFGPAVLRLAGDGGGVVTAMRATFERDGLGIGG